MIYLSYAKVVIYMYTKNYKIGVYSIMKQIKKSMFCGLALILAGSSFTGCVTTVGTQEKSDVSYLYVNTRDCGYGDGYLKALEPIFEARYANESFAEGKTGVDLVVATSANLAGTQYRDTIANSTYNVSVLEGMYYFDYLAGKSLYDMTNIVKNKQLQDGSGTIESKLFDDQKEALTVDNGKYYALPVFTGISGLTYDADLLENNFLYFADKDGLKPTATSSYTGKAYTGRGFDATGAEKKSPGPDGKYDTYDDGLPITKEDWNRLLTQLTRNKRADSIESKSEIPFDRKAGQGRTRPVTCSAFLLNNGR